MLTSGQIWRFHFAGVQSKTSLDRVLARLVRDKLIARLGRRQVLGDGAGSGQAVYQLAANGWLYIGHRGKFSPRFRAISEHRLRVADAFAQLCDREDAGEIKVRGYHTEPDTHRRLAGVTVRPDFYIEVELIEAGEVAYMWLEIDRDNEGRAQIEKKAREYVAVYEGATPAEIEVIPTVLFLVENELSRRTLEGYLHGKTGAYSHMFGVDMLDGFANRLK